MSGIEDWLDLMPDEVTVQSFISYDAYSNPSYGSPNVFQARVTYRNRRVLNDKGEEVVARGEAWLATILPISARDKVMLSDGTLPLILNVSKVSDEDGPLYTKLDFA